MACDKRSLYAVSGGQDSITAFSTIALQSGLKPKLQSSLHCEYEKRRKDDLPWGVRIRPSDQKVFRNCDVLPNAFTLRPIMNHNRKGEREGHETDGFWPKKPWERFAAHQAQWLLKEGRSATLPLEHQKTKAERFTKAISIGKADSRQRSYGHFAFPLYHCNERIGANTLERKKKNSGCFYYDHSPKIDFDFPVSKTHTPWKAFVKWFPNWVAPKHTALAIGELSSLGVYCKRRFKDSTAMAKRTVSVEGLQRRLGGVNERVIADPTKETFAQRPVGRVRHCPWDPTRSRHVTNPPRKANVGALGYEQRKRGKSHRLQWFYQKTHSINRNQPLAVRKLSLSLKQPLYQSVSQNDLRKGDSNEINEDKSRMARYDCFMQISLKHNFSALTVSHTASDTTENVLTNVFKGSNPWFLSGMTRSLIVRPFLWLSRWETKFLCRKYRLPVHVDKSNGIPSLLSFLPPSSPYSHFRSSLIHSWEKQRLPPHVRLEGGNERNRLRYIILPFIQFTTLYDDDKTATASDFIGSSRATTALHVQSERDNSSAFNTSIEMNAARYATLLSYDCDYYIRVVKSITKLHLYQSYSYVIRFFIKTLLFHEFVNA